MLLRNLITSGIRGSTVSALKDPVAYGNLAQGFF